MPHGQTNNTNADLDHVMLWRLCYVLCVTSDARLSRLYLDPVSQEGY